MNPFLSAGIVGSSSESLMPMPSANVLALFETLAVPISLVFVMLGMVSIMQGMINVFFGSGWVSSILIGFICFFMASFIQAVAGNQSFLAVFSGSPEPKDPFEPVGPSLPSVDWSTILMVVGLIVASIVVFCGASLLVRKHRTRVAHLEAEKAETARVQEELREHNLCKVQGIDYALIHGLVSDEQLRTVQPEELQMRIDADNPFAEEISHHLAMLRDYEVVQESLSRRDRKRVARLTSQLREMREAPEVVRARGLASNADAALAKVQEDLRQLQQLSED